MTSSAERSAAFSEMIRHELASGEFVFPTSMQAAVKVRRALDEEDADIDTVAKMINLEPLLSVKLLRMANSALYNPSGTPVVDVKSALMRVGLNNARVLALAVIGDQLATAQEFAPVWRLAEQLWRHTLEVASLAYAIASQLRGVPKDAALLAGMVHDIGQFYLLSRVHEFPELLEEGSELSEFILFWHKDVGQGVLQALGTPESIVKALQAQDVFGGGWPPSSLSDVIFLANSAAGIPNPFTTVSLELQLTLKQSAFEGADPEVVQRMLDDARDQRSAALAMLSA